MKLDFFVFFLHASTGQEMGKYCRDLADILMSNRCLIGIQPVTFPVLQHLTNWDYFASTSCQNVHK